MKQIDPIISIIGMLIISLIIGVNTSSTIGLIVFSVMYAIGLLGDKIIGNIPNSHD